MNYYCTAFSDAAWKYLYALQAEHGSQDQPCACLRCEDVPGHKLHQELWSSHCSLACGIALSTGPGPSGQELRRMSAT